MTVVNPAFVETIAPQRPVEAFGEETFTPLKAVPAVLSLAHAKAGTVFVPRGTDLQASDRFTYQGRTWRVMGWPRGDQDHPFTGDDFGWVSYEIEAAT